MRPRTLLILTLLVGGLAAFVWWFEGGRPSTDERAERARYVLSLEPEKVTAFEIERGGASVRLERGEASEGAGVLASYPWRVVDPIRNEGDRDRVRRFLDALSNLEKQRTVEGADLAQLGLDAPEAVIVVELGETVQALRVGREVPGSTSRAVALEGEAGQAYVVAGAFLDEAETDPEPWRDHALFPAAREDIRLLRLERRGAEPVSLRRAENGDVTVVSAGDDRADRDTVNQLLAALVDLKASRFLSTSPDDPTTLGLEPPEARITVELADGEPFRLDLGAGLSEGLLSRYGRVAGEHLILNTDFAPWLDRAAADWRSLDATDLDSWRVETLRVEGRLGEDPGESLEVRRDGSDWYRNDELVPYDVVGELLEAATALRGEAFGAADLPAPLGALSLTLIDENGTELRLTLGPAEDGLHGLWPAARPGTVLRVAADQVDRLRLALSSVRAAEPLDRPAGSLPEGVTVDVEEGND